MEKITDSIYYVGTDHPECRLFESQYHVPHGMAYNAYMIKGDKNVLIDTVDKVKKEEYLANVKEVLNGEDLDYLVVQHLEPDHSAAIEDIISLYPNAKIIASAKAVSMLPQFIDTDVTGRTIPVKDGDTLEVNGRTLSFVTAPMVHWPEVIMTYDDKDKVLFAADAFGKFGTRDADEPWEEEGARYFLNIVGKYGKQVQAVLKKAAGLDIEKILALHGPALTENLGYYIDLYDKWSSYTPDKEGIFIAVASIHGHTNLVADKMKELLVARGEKVILMDLTRQDVHEAVAQAFRHKKTLLIACSYDAGVFPPMERFLSILSHKAFQNRTIAMIENGSWAPSAARTMKSLIEGCKDLTLVEPVVTIKTSMKEADLPKLEELADNLVKAE